MTGFPSVVVTVKGVPVDTCRVLMPLEIVHGRSSIGYQPDAPTCAFDWDGPTPPGELGDTLQVGYPTDDTGTWLDQRIKWTDPVWTWLGQMAGYWRFTGTITSLTAVESGGEVVRWRVQGTGHQARLASVPVLLDRPAETDVSRVQAIAAAAGVTVGVRGTSTLQLRADLIDRDALSAIHEVAASAGGLLWQTPDGDLVYGTANHRDNPVTRSLPCEVIEDGIDWEQDLSLVTNHVVLRWGPEGSQTQDTFRDDASIAKWGRQGIDIETLALDRTQAGALAALILARRKDPYWRMPDVVLDYGWMSPPQASQAQALAVGDALTLPVPAAPGPTPSDATLWLVEGWAETWDTIGHRQQVAVSDAARSITGGIATWATQKTQTWAYWRPTSWTDQLVKVGP